MTGEITLRGQVLPVGGIKEKVLAAHRSGLRKIVLPKRNDADLEDLPEEVLKSLEFVFVETVDDVLAAALEPAPEKTSSEKTGGNGAPSDSSPEKRKGKKIEKLTASAVQQGSKEGK
jgi:ATP-dependent Lon protease